MDHVFKKGTFGDLRPSDNPDVPASLTVFRVRAVNIVWRHCIDSIHVTAPCKLSFLLLCMATQKLSSYHKMEKRYRQASGAQTDI